MYVLGAVSSPPAGSGFEAVATYDGRYVRFTSDSGQHGALGGANQHRHVVQAGNSLTSSWCQRGYLQEPAGMVAHSHPFASVNTSYSDNDPLYRTYRLWRIDLNVWEGQHRNFPVGAVLLASNTISAPNFTRESACDGRLIKLGPPGVEGGRSTHDDHSGSLTLATLTPGATGTSGAGGSGITVAPRTNHGHNVAWAALPENTILPRCLTVLMYRVMAGTDFAPANVVCFFDGVPSANWKPLGWDAAFPMGDGNGGSANGEDSHGHVDTNKTSSTFNTTSSAYSWGYDSYPTVNYHAHSVPIAVDTVDHLPEYVSLCPYYLNTTLWQVRCSPIMW